MKLERALWCRGEWVRNSARTAAVAARHEGGRWRHPHGRDRHLASSTTGQPRLSVPRGARH
jgi:hypothetical protein